MSNIWKQCATHCKYFYQAKGCCKCANILQTKEVQEYRTAGHEICGYYEGGTMTIEEMENLGYKFYKTINNINVYE